MKRSLILALLPALVSISIYTLIWLPYRDQQKAAIAKAKSHLVAPGGSSRSDGEVVETRLDPPKPIEHPAVNAIERPTIDLDALKKIRAMPRPPRLVTPDDDYISGTYVTLLGMTGDEISVVESAIRKARSEIAELSVSHATVSTVNGSSVRLDISAFEGGDTIYKELNSSLREALGDERYAVFADVALLPLNDALYYFGRKPRTIVVRRSAEDSTVSVMDMLDAVTMPNGFINGGSGSVATSLDPSQLLPRYRPFKALIQKGFDTPNIQ
jgi:hypothetical protein